MHFKINSTLIDNAEGLDNLLEYSQNYSLTSGSLLNYYSDENDVTDNAADGKSLYIKQK